MVFLQGSATTHVYYQQQPQQQHMWSSQQQVGYYSVNFAESLSFRSFEDDAASKTRTNHATATADDVFQSRSTTVAAA